MAELPGGTVTFLFTDIAGSTGLLEEVGAAAYAELLGEHRRLVREAVAAHGGVEVDTQGDAFFCAFASAREAAACAARAQERLAATPVRVRMGLHSGEALVSDGHYVGMDVHRAARIAATGHGGQVVVSPTTAALLDPGSFPLRDLGEHRLKDLSAPQRLYQLGAGDFPRLETLHRTNLPVPTTSFVGRRVELEAVTAQLRDPGTRLVTLTGPGGSGKTRLALQVAAELADDVPGGVFWVPLAPLRDGGLVAPALLDALGIEDADAAEPAGAVAAALQLPTLVLLDNCEHLLDASAAIVGALLPTAPQLRVIATSREPLALGGERVIAVDPLERADAVSLFNVRAEAAGAAGLDEDAVARLCARLDDLPLAVEIAAARAATLPPQILLDRLSQRLQLLQGPRDADERQQTLRATISWSYDLLDADEQRIMRRLSLFAGAAGLDAVESVVGADLEQLASLVAKSLLRFTQAPDGPRYWLLETIREFAAGLLGKTDEAEGLRDLYVQWFAGLAATAAGHLGEPDVAQWLERLEADLGNLRVAFGLALERRHPGVGPFACLLAELHAVHGRFGEARDVLVAARPQVDEPRQLADLHRLLGEACTRRGELDEAAGAYATAGALLGQPDEGADPEHWRLWLELQLSHAHYHYWHSDVDALTRAAEELRPDIEAHGTTRQRADFGYVALQGAFRRERYVLSEETERLARSAWTASRSAGDWDASFLLGFALLWRGLLEEAEVRLQEAREDARAVGDPLIEVRALVYRAIVRRKLGDVEAVRALDAELAALDDRFGYDGIVAGNGAWLALRDGREADVERLAAGAIGHWRDAGRVGPTVFQWSARFPLLAVDAARGRLEAASAHARAMLDPRQQPLPDGVQAALRRALERGAGEAFEEAVLAARPGGYT